MPTLRLKPKTTTPPKKFRLKAAPRERDIGTGESAAEELLISSLLRSKKYGPVLDAGINHRWFTAYVEEWLFIERFYRRHKRLPSVNLFGAKFSEFNVIQVIDIDYAIEEMRLHHARQSLLSEVDSVLLGLTEGRDVAGLITSAQQNLIGLQSRLEGTKNEIELVREYDDIYTEALMRQKKAQDSGRAGIPTGFATLDAVTSGLHDGESWIVAARWGVGKTWTLIAMACAALDAGLTVQFDALEQTKGQLAMRFHAFLSRAYGKTLFRASDLSHGIGYDAREYKAFLEDLRDKMPGSLIINDTPRGRMSVSTLRAQYERNGQDISFIDYISLMAKDSGNWAEVADISAEIKGFAMDSGTVTVSAAQLNQQQGLARSDAIGADADGLMKTTRRSDHVVQIELDKYRHGSQAAWYCEFRPNEGIYKEITRDEADQIQADDKAGD